MILFSGFFDEYKIQKNSIYFEIVLTSDSFNVSLKLLLNNSNFFTKNSADPKCLLYGGKYILYKYY